VSFQELDILTGHDGMLQWRVMVKQSHSTVLFDVTDLHSGEPFSKPTQWLEDQIEDGHLKKAVPQGTARTTDNMVDYARRTHARFARVLETTRLLTPAGRSAAFQELRLTDTKVTYKTFMKVVRLWFASGGVPDAMLPAWDRCGPSPLNTTNLDAISLADAKRACREKALELDLNAHPMPTQVGVPRKDGKPRKRALPRLPTLYTVDRETLRVFMNYWKTMKGKTGRSLVKAYKDMCIEVFTSVDPLGKTVYWDPRRIPSERQFRDWYETLNDYKARRLNQVRDKDFETQEREQLGNEFSVGITAGAVGSGDATIWNVGLRSRFATREVIGPAVVFRIRDKRTGMLLGISVGFESASWSGFATAIANCYEDKVAFCARYGITITPEVWPVRGLPASIEADCGETDNTKPDYFIAATGVRFKNIIGGRPDMKPGTESDWHTLQVAMNGDTPGALIERWQAATKREWRVRSVLDIDQFMHNLLLIELDRMKQLREGVLLPAEMIAAGANSSSLSMWRWHVEHHGGGLRSVDPDKTTLSLLDRESGSITEGGVMFRGISYVASELVAKHSFARARREGARTVTIAFDTRLVDTVYILERDRSVIKCKLNMKLEHQHDYTGKSFAEVKTLREREDINAAAHALTAHQSSLTMREATLNKVKEATELTNQSTSAKLPPGTQMKALKESRKRERFEHSPSQAMRPYTNEPQAPPANVVSIDRPKPGRAPFGSLFGSMIAELSEQARASTDSPATSKEAKRD